MIGEFIYVNTNVLNESDMKEYHSRKDQITCRIQNYDDQIRNYPEIQYLDTEIETWNKVFTKLNEIYPLIACPSYLSGLEDLKKNKIFFADQIPTFKNVSEFMESRTGFRLYPISGLLSPKQFLQGLAYKIFYCTQYIRHPSKPFYTPEPDIIHEMLGHVPMFLDPDICEISEMIGKAALVCSENKIVELERLYWFSIEFGLVCENEQEKEKEQTKLYPKIYGAGLLSSASEMEKILNGSKEVSIYPFEMDKVISDKPLITDFQTNYYVVKSIQDLKSIIKKFLVNYI